MRGYLFVQIDFFFMFGFNEHVLFDGFDCGFDSA